jgi:hypothetical protein
LPADPVGGSDFDADSHPDCAFGGTNEVSHRIPYCKPYRHSYGVSNTPDKFADSIAHSKTVQVALHVSYNPNPTPNHHEPDGNAHTSTYHERSYGRANALTHGRTDWCADFPAHSDAHCYAHG